MSPAERGVLYVVATPVGNRDDLSPRARRVLAEVDLVAAEDTRRTGRLLSHFGIEQRLMALHEHNEQAAADAVLAHLDTGRSVALVSDAGTPLVSDPGYRLLDAAHRHGARVSPVPGPSAVTAALSVAGLPTDAWCFGGFLPARDGARRERLAALAREPRTMVFFETPHRIGAALTALAGAFGEDRLAFLGRELTKLHEQCLRAPLGQLAAQLTGGVIPARGEFVLVVAGAAPAPAGEAAAAVDVDRLLAELVRVLPGRRAVDVAAAVTGRPKNELYRRMLAL